MKSLCLLLNSQDHVNPTLFNIMTFSLTILLCMLSLLLLNRTIFFKKYYVTYNIQCRECFVRDLNFCFRLAHQYLKR
jgi:hypothetical protein